jgi:hypothetical protein
MSAIDVAACLEKTSGKDIETVVHLGAGDGRCIDGYSARPPKRLVLVEGDPLARGELLSRARGLPWVEVRGEVAAASSGPVPWNTFNVPAFSGLLQPGRLRDYFPGLRLSSTATVDATALETLLAAVGADATRPMHNLLVLDLPGAELRLLESLSESTLLTYGWIAFKAAQTVLHEDGCAAGETVDWLQQQAYQPVLADRASEPLWSTHVVRLNPLGREVARLRGQLDDVRARHAKLRAQASQTADENTTLKQRVEALDRELGEARQTAALSAKLAALRDADLRELQSRHQALVAELDRRDEILRALADRLGAAVRYHAQLSGTGPAPSDGGLAMPPGHSAD